MSRPLKRPYLLFNIDVKSQEVVRFDRFADDLDALVSAEDAHAEKTDPRIVSFVFDANEERVIYVEAPMNILRG